MNRRQLKKKIAEITKKSKYECKLSDEVVRTICNAERVDQEALIKAMYDITENPFAGDIMNMKKIRARKHEICGCKEKFEIYLDKNSNEIYFTCKNGECEGAWMTKEEFEDGRKGYNENRKNKQRHIRR